MAGIYLSHSGRGDLALLLLSVLPHLYCPLKLYSLFSKSIRRRYFNLFNSPAVWQLYQTYLINMQEERHIYGHNEEEVWQQINEDLIQNPDLLQYRAIIHQQNKEIMLDIDIDLGGGFEGGYATTILSAPFRNPEGFKFALHEESFFDDLGKFFGMQDVKIGYPDFDDQIIVKTTDESRVRTFLNDDTIREGLLNLKDFTFEVVLPDDGDTENNDSRLELIIEEGITDPARLRPLYDLFFSTLNMIAPFSL
jgi:hypothetical protein